MQPDSGASKLKPILRKLEYWVSFDDVERAAILSLPHRVRHVERQTHIVRDGDRPDQSSLLLSGFAVRQKIVAGGARQIVAVHMKGDLVDLQNSFLGVADHGVQMITSGEVASISSEAIQQLAFRHPRIGKALWFDSLVDASIFREWIANVGRRDAHTRVAHLLCELSLRLKVAGLGEATNYELPMTQEQIADCTGLTPVHVNRTLKSLDAEGLITRYRSRSVRIENWRKLADAGDFNSTYLHLRHDEPALA